MSRSRPEQRERVLRASAQSERHRRNYNDLLTRLVIIGLLAAICVQAGSFL